MVVSLPHVNVYLFLSPSPSPSLPSPPIVLPPGRFLAGSWDCRANQDISSGWVNISLFLYVCYECLIQCV